LISVEEAPEPELEELANVYRDERNEAVSD
jgi:hypothetical protein